MRPFANPWTIAYQAPPSMGFSRQEHWSGLSFPSPADLTDPGIKSGSPALEGEALTSEPCGINTSELTDLDVQKYYLKRLTHLCARPRKSYRGHTGVTHTHTHTANCGHFNSYFDL